jgi:uncharacterized protein (TIGR02217 family)
MTERFTRVEAQVLGTVVASGVNFTRVDAEVLGSNGGILQQRFTRIEADVLGAPAPPDIKFTRIMFQVLATRTATFEYTSVVNPDVFPFDISYNTVGSIRFATDVTVVDSGDDQRVSRWDQPLMEFDVAYGVRTMDQLTALITLFRAMRGRLYAFCYQDWTDYTSSVATEYAARQAPTITALDQAIGVGDGLTTTFQLTKTYPSQTQQLIRPITQPQPNSVLAAINDAPTTNFTVDNTTGLITFTSPLSITVAGACSKTASGGGAGGVSTIVGPVGAFHRLAAFVGYNCIMSNWTQPLDNTSEAVLVSINSVNTDGSTLVVGYPQGYGNYVETGVTGVNVQVHPAPLPDAVISAGFLFFVPVRFDTDTLPIRLEDYGVGSSTSVKLIEVRPSDPQ